MSNVILEVGKYYWYLLNGAWRMGYVRLQPVDKVLWFYDAAFERDIWPLEISNIEHIEEYHFTECAMPGKPEK